MNSLGLFRSGIYTVPDAARITGVSPSRIRRWLRGYEWDSRGNRGASEAIFYGDLPMLDAVVAVSFLDLIEIRFIDGFLKLGVTWRKMRELHGKAKAMVDSQHPFSTEKFKTDGKTIVAELGTETGAKILIDLASNQQFFQQIMSPYLKGLKFRDNQVMQWWPLGDQRAIVLDPTQRFGAPIIARRGIPTSLLAKAFRVEGSIEVVASWMNVTEAEVADAVEYEAGLAA